MAQIQSAFATVGLSGTQTITGAKTFTSKVTVDVNSEALVVSTDGTDSSAGAFVVNPANQTAGVWSTDSAKLIGISMRTPGPAGTATVGGYFNGLGIGGFSSSGNNPIFGVLNSAQSGEGIGHTALTVTDTNVVQSFNNALDDGTGKMSAAGIISANAGTSSAGSAPILTAVAGTNGGAAVQLSDVTRDYMVYLQVGTAGTAWVVQMGHTSAGNDVTLHASGVATAGQTLSFRLPAGWYFLWSATTATLAQSVAVGC